MYFAHAIGIGRVVVLETHGGAGFDGIRTVLIDHDNDGKFDSFLESDDVAGDLGGGWSDNFFRYYP